MLAWPGQTDRLAGPRPCSPLPPRSGMTPCWLVSWSVVSRPEVEAVLVEERRNGRFTAGFGLPVFELLGECSGEFEDLLWRDSDATNDLARDARGVVAVLGGGLCWSGHGDEVQDENVRGVPDVREVREHPVGSLVREGDLQLRALVGAHGRCSFGVAGGLVLDSLGPPPVVRGWAETGAGSSGMLLNRSRTSRKASLVLLVTAGGAGDER